MGPGQVGALGRCPCCPGPGPGLLNTYECWQENENLVGSRGLLRDLKKIWLRVFPYKFGHYTVEEAELWALIYGLRQAWEEGIRFLISKVDYLNVFNWISKEGMEGAKYKSMIQ